MRFFSTLLASALGTFVAFGVLFLIGLLLLIGLLASADRTPVVPASSVLRFDLSGFIPELATDDPVEVLLTGGQEMDLRDVKLALQKAAADDRISAVWLHPEGLLSSWATLEEIRMALEAFKESGKLLIATAGPNGFSEAEYFLASAADSVFAPPEAGFEFNGFFIAVTFFKDMLDRLNVRPQVVRAGTYKSAVEPFTRTDLSPENERQIRAILETQSEVFYTAVARSRGLARADLERLAADSALYTAEAAFRAGLLDGLRYEDETEALLKRQTNRDPDDALRQIDLADYANVSPTEAGLAEGGRAEIAVVYAEGIITSGRSRFDPNPLFGGTVVGSETFVEALEEAQDDEDVKAIVLRINSPGGSGTASDVMWRAVHLAAREKPVIVSMGDVAASGGYYIAAPADTIVADLLTLTGSIGVFSLFLDTSGLFEDKLGITFDAVKTGPYADMFSGIRPLDPAEQALLARQTDAFYQTFLRRVADGRGMTMEQVDSVAQGRLWTGLQAREAGLVDVLGGLGLAVDLAAERAGLAPDAYRVRTLPRPPGFLERFGVFVETRAVRRVLARGLSAPERFLLRQAGGFNQLYGLDSPLQARLPWRPDIR